MVVEDILSLLNNGTLLRPEILFSLVLFGIAYWYILSFRIHYKNRLKELLETDIFILTLLFSLIGFFGGYAGVVFENVFRAVYNINVISEFYGSVFLALMAVLIGKFRILRNEKLLDLSILVTFIILIVTVFIPWEPTESVLYIKIYPITLSISLFVFLMSLGIKITKWLFLIDEKIAKTGMADENRKGKNRYPVFTRRKGIQETS